VVSCFYCNWISDDTSSDKIIAAGYENDEEACVLKLWRWQDSVWKMDKGDLISAEYQMGDVFHIASVMEL
jgi:hypothetical protein